MAVTFKTGAIAFPVGVPRPVVNMTHMEDNMDVDLSGIIEGTKTIEESGKMLLDEIVQVCNGKLTKAEAYGFSDIAVDHVCRFV